MALRWKSDEPDWALRNALTRLAAVTNEAIERIESRRLAEVRARIDRKILEELHPKDLLYQILDGLRSLTGYDHSGAILLRVDSTAVFELVAEQMAFRKGKSPRIGVTFAMEEPLLGALTSDGAWGYSANEPGEGSEGGWSAWTHGAPAGLAAWLTGGLSPAGVGGPAEEELICAPLRSGGELAGILKIAARHHGTFGPYEGELVAAFLPHAMIALRNARRVESLEHKMIQAERKHAMADLARGVSHDINNALGAVLPLVQQMREEIESGRAERGTLAADLAQVEQSLRTCTRIFGGMLQFGRRAAHESGGREARIESALDSALAILGEGLKRCGVEVRRDIDPDLPALPVRQSELEQLFLNLVGNGRDAIAATGCAGRLTVSARGQAGVEARRRFVRVEVADDGIGISAEHLGRVIEPFFTTKPSGNGLGLTICRSIVWQCQGRMWVESPGAVGFEPSRPGARVTIEVPVEGPAEPGSAS
jgi:signal transduction histidine kinase